MSAAQQVSRCEAILPALDTYLDGELAPRQMVDVESHLRTCPSCREKLEFQRAYHRSLRALPAPEVSEEFRERISIAMRKAGSDAERTPFDVSLGGTQLSPQRKGSKSGFFWMSLAVAAGVLAVVTARRMQKLRDRPETLASGGRAEARARHGGRGRVARANMLNFDGVMDDLVAVHASPLPPEVKDPLALRRFDSFVGVPIRAPRLTHFGAKLEGGRILPLRDQRRAAMLQYSLKNGHRVTVYVFDPHRVRPATTRTLRARVVRKRPVYVGHLRGYNVAATQRNGVGYALATDLGEPESVRLVTAEFH